MSEAPQVGLEPTTLRLTVGESRESEQGDTGNAPPTTASARPGSPSRPQASPQVTRFGPAVLRALAAWRDARQNGGDGFNALFNLALALDADGAAHPVPVGDEGERTPGERCTYETFDRDAMVAAIASAAHRPRAPRGKPTAEGELARRDSVAYALAHYFADGSSVTRDEWLMALRLTEQEAELASLRARLAEGEDGERDPSPFRFRTPRGESPL